MTTQEFISKQFGNANGKAGHCSSVIKDGKGNIFSYGSHYPLLFKIGDKVFINTAGYSNTTSRHIAYAWRAVNYQAIEVKLGYKTANAYTGRNNDAYIIAASYTTDEEKLAVIRAAQKRELDDLAEQLDAKKRRDTWVFSNLQRQHYNAKTAYALAGGK